MFPYLDFAVVSFVLFAGFGLGALFGCLLKETRSQRFFDGDGGELVALPHVTEARAGHGSDLAEVIPFLGSRRRSNAV